MYAIPAGVTTLTHTGTWSNNFLYIGGHASNPNNGVDSTNDLWIDSLLVTDQGYPGGYFDGDTFGVSWTGPMHASISQGTPMETVPAVLQEPWIGGMGHAGCRFNGKPTFSSNTPINGGQVGFAASFREVGNSAYA